VYVGKATALTLDLAGPLAHFLVCAAIWVYHCRGRVRSAAAALLGPAALTRETVALFAIAYVGAFAAERMAREALWIAALGLLLPMLAGWDDFSAGNYCSELLHAGGLAGCVEWDVR
jgi:hypothetical protein